MRGPLRALCVAALLALAAPGGALAAVKTIVLQSAPIRIGAYGVDKGAQLVPSPREDGYVTGVRAQLVDLMGNPVPDTDVMLHHVVLAKLGSPDLTCSSVEGVRAERFYAEGEEHFSLALPNGYGYPNRASDLWGLVAMLMNHNARPSTVQVRYTVTYVTGEPRTAVTPVWLDVRNCRSDPVFSVPGTGGAGSTFTEQADFKLPFGGVLVAGGGHVHGGGLSLDVADTSCGSLFTSYPSWGGIEPTPVMHEPGPVAMTGFSDPAGRPVRAGDTLRLTATYDNARPHVRAMGIAILFLAPAPVPACRTYSSPRPASTTPENVTVALLKQPTGTPHRVRGTWVGDYAFGAQRVTLKRGTMFTWRFVGAVEHDITLASGPVGFASPSVKRGTYSFRFSRAGTYKLFCSLHPARMTQIVNVR